MTASVEFQGKKWSIRTARLAFPIVVAYAKQHRSLTYQDLDNELARLYGTPHKRRLTVYGYALGVIGFAIEKRYGHRVPPANALVIGKYSKRPGDGCDHFLRQYTRSRRSFKNLPRPDQLAVVDAVHEKIFQYSRWDDVLHAFNLESVPDIRPIKGRKRLKRYGKNFSREGESKAHKRLKEYVNRHPEAIDISKKLAPGRKEYVLQSGDKPDVYFPSANPPVGVEVKSRVSNDDDLNRGIYQCVKYRAVLRAEQLEMEKVPNAEAVLVCEARLPVPLREKAQFFGIYSFDGVKPN